MAGEMGMPQAETSDGDMTVGSLRD
jgi:hypothetical protein